MNMIRLRWSAVLALVLGIALGTATLITPTHAAYPTFDAAQGNNQGSS